MSKPTTVEMVARGWLDLPECVTTWGALCDVVDEFPWAPDRWHDELMFRRGPDWLRLVATIAARATSPDRSQLARLQGLVLHGPEPEDIGKDNPLCVQAREFLVSCCGRLHPGAFHDETPPPVAPRGSDLLWYAGPSERVRLGYHLGWVDEVMWVWNLRDVGRGTPLRFDPAAILTTDPVRTVFVPGPDWNPESDVRFGFSFRCCPRDGRWAVEQEYVEADPYRGSDPGGSPAPDRTYREDTYDTRAEAVCAVSRLIPQVVELLTGWCAETTAMMA